MIDHVLVSRGLLPWYRGAEIYNELLPDESVCETADSDHAPVVGVFALPAEADAR